jgi:hypothetical protein
MKIKHVPDCTVVQLTDGRIGWKGVNSQSTKKNLVIFANGEGAELQPNDEVEVVKFPAQIAREYVEALPIQKQAV